MNTTNEIIPQNYNLSGHSTPTEKFDFEFEVGKKYTVTYKNTSLRPNQLDMEGVYVGILREENGVVLIGFRFDGGQGSVYYIDSDFHKDWIFQKVPSTYNIVFINEIGMSTELKDFIESFNEDTRMITPFQILAYTGMLEDMAGDRDLKTNQPLHTQEEINRFNRLVTEIHRIHMLLIQRKVNIVMLCENTLSEEEITWQNLG